MTCPLWCHWSEPGYTWVLLERTAVVLKGMYSMFLLQVVQGFSLCHQVIYAAMPPPPQDALAHPVVLDGQLHLKEEAGPADLLEAASQHDHQQHTGSLDNSSSSVVPFAHRGSGSQARLVYSDRYSLYLPHDHPCPQ